MTSLRVGGRRGDRKGLRGMLVVELLGTGYALFAFIGLGHEPFQLGLQLAAAGVPLYAFMRWAQGHGRRRMPGLAACTAPPAKTKIMSSHGRGSLVPLTIPAGRDA